MNNKLAYLITTLYLFIGLPLYADYEEPNDPNAMFDLAFRYYDGDGVKKNYAEAVRWWRNAADRGNADAMYELGRYLAKKSYAGRSFVAADDPNFLKGIEWIRKAAKLGHEGAKEALNKLGD